MNNVFQNAKIPAYLLTGYLGSGKTTLLASWLREEELSESALVINEIGEVGLDQHLLNAATEGLTLVANACVCCTGLPALSEALADLFWARLQRKIRPFRSVIIETTGLADPEPIVQIFKHDSLLNERYRLAGVVVTISATSGFRTLDMHPEAISQMTAADLVIITKTDLVPQAVLDELAATVVAFNPNAKLALSSKASLTAGSMLSMLPASAVHQEPITPMPERAEASDPELGHHHQHAAALHSAETLFLALPRPLERRTLALQLGLWILKHEARLLRVKGMVTIQDDFVVTVQWAHGDPQADIAPFGRGLGFPPTVQMGLTVIAEKEFDPGAGQALVVLLQSSAIQES